MTNPPATTSDSPASAPSRDILRVLARHGKVTGIDDLAGQLGFPQGDLQDLELRVRKLVRSGILVVRNDGSIGLMDSVQVVEGTVIGHPGGYGFLDMEGIDEDAFINRGDMKKVLHGDRVQALLVDHERTNKTRARIIEVLNLQARELAGRFQSGRRGGIVIPDDSRYGRNIEIFGSDCGEAADGDLVAVEIVEHPFQRREIRGRILKILGQEGDIGIETELAVYNYELPHLWPDGIGSELDEVPARYNAAIDEKGRRDLQDLAFVTIDGSDARDFDDAVFATRKGKGWKLYVAIADVSHFVLPNSELDREAYCRGTSVYFPRRVIPMLPELLSNDFCSLRPNQVRAVMVCEMSIKSGAVQEYEFYSATIQSRARLTYDQVHDYYSGIEVSQVNETAGVAGNLDQLMHLYESLRAARKDRGAIDFEIPEAILDFDTEGRVVDVRRRDRLTSHMLIEECMLAANVCAAKCISEHFGAAGLYRNHEGPDQAGLVELRGFLKSLGLHLGGGNQPTASDYSRLVGELDPQRGISGPVQTMLLRSLSQAVYENDCRGHFALAYAEYTHFTSPIRRYSDLIVHRLLKSIAANNKGSIGPAGIGVEAAGNQCSMTERRAESAGFDVIRRLKARFMEAHVGKEYPGVISGVQDFGIFVVLDDHPIDGLVHVSNLGQDYFVYDRVRMELEGRRNGRRFRLGDSVRVTVGEVDSDMGKIDFLLVNTGSRKPRDRYRKKHGRK